MIGTLHKVKEKWVVRYDEMFFTQPPHPKGVFGVIYRHMTKKELPLHPESLDKDGYKREFFEGELVNFIIVENYGIDPYDNQVPGIDYKDVAKLVFDFKDEKKKITRVSKIKMTEDWEDVSSDLRKFCDKKGYTSRPLMTVIPFILEYLESKYNLLRKS